jgi:glycosyltransferase 2 family protein
MPWSVLLGVLVSATCMSLIISQVHFSHLLATLRSAHYLLLVSAVLMLGLTHLMRAWRWRYILVPVKPIPLRRLLSATAIGLMANMLLPVHAGEVIRAYILRRREGVGMLVSMATLLVECMADLVSLLLIVVLLLVFSSVPMAQTPAVATRLKIGSSIAAFLCLVLVGNFWLLTTRTTQTLQCVRTRLAFLPPRWLGYFIDTLTDFAVGLHALTQGWQVVPILVLSLLQWFMVAINNAFILQAFDLQLPLYALFLLLIMEILGVLIPSAPGFLGTYHAAVVAGLAVVGVPQERAISVAILMHAAFFFPAILAGLVFLWQESLSLRDLWSVDTRHLEC